MPVVADDGKLVGIVSEGDLLHRTESETERRQSWWLNLFASSEERARDYVKSHGRRAEEVMTRDVVTCSSEDRVHDLMKKMTSGRFRHLPVIDGSSLTGIISIGDVVKSRLEELEAELVR